MLNRSDGREYTFDSDRDGRAEYMPALFLGTHSGNRYPPIVGQDGLIYFSNPMNKSGIPQGRVMGWLPGYSMLSQVGGQGAVDEPQAISVGGDLIYRSLCCDRVGDWFSATSNQSGSMWSYDNALSEQAPGYDQMWYTNFLEPGDTVRLRGNYGNANGIYHNHGDQNPPVPYNGRVYIHRSNAVIAFGSGGLMGVGFGNSLQKYAYLPENTTDSIFAIVGEELGFMGATVIILLFVLIIWRGFYIASSAKDLFGKLLAGGITAFLAFQILINLAAQTALLPLTGVPLPFISYGGSALIMNLGAIGILLNIGRQGHNK
jgi:hypothetical protein